MKKWILPLLAAVLTVSACGVLSSETREEKTAREAREARMVVDNLQSGNFSIDITRMYPVRGSSKMVQNYSVTVKDGVLDSHLPYVGRAWRVPYGGGHALNFKDKIVNYNVDEGVTVDGEDVIYAEGVADGHLAVLVDSNVDGVVDTLILDENDNQLGDSFEYHDISGEGITVNDLYMAAGEDPFGGQDYTNDADVNSLC